MKIKTIEELLNYSQDMLLNMTYEEVTYTCDHLLRSVPMSIVDFDNKPFYFKQPEGGGSNLLYRGRLITNKQNVGHEKVQDISFIPKEKTELIKDFGRVNKPRQSMFYGSLDWCTACIETISHGFDFKNNDSCMLTVGIWAFQSPLTFVQIPHSIKYFNEFYKKVPYKPTQSIIDNIITNNARINKSLRNELDIKILTFFADEFAKFNFDGFCDYKLSNYYADRVFNRTIADYTENIDGIIYPSIPNSYEKLNIALEPQVINDGKLRFVDAMQVWITDPMGKYGNTQFTPLYQNVDADINGYLQWPYLK